MNSKNTFWLNTPSVLFKKSAITELWPSNDFSLERKLNSITRFIILITLVSYFLFKRVSIIFLGLIFILIIIMYYLNFDKISTKIENFSLIPKNMVEKPTPSNPFMNPLTSDFGTDNKTKKALDAELYGEDLNNNVKNLILELNKDNQDKTKLFDNLEKNEVFDNSMRQFHINPSTTFPNDQKDFLDFCYGSMPTNKNINVY